MKAVKFLVINEKTSEQDYTIVCQDGGFGTLHFNGQHIVASMCKSRIDKDMDLETMLQTIEESDQSFIDFEKHRVNPSMIEEVCNWLYMSTEETLVCIEYIEQDGNFNISMGNNGILNWLKQF